MLNEALVIWRHKTVVFYVGSRQDPILSFVSTYKSNPQYAPQLYVNLSHYFRLHVCLSVTEILLTRVRWRCEGGAVFGTLLFLFGVKFIRLGNEVGTESKSGNKI